MLQCLIIPNISNILVKALTQHKEALKSCLQCITQLRAENAQKGIRLGE